MNMTGPRRENSGKDPDIGADIEYDAFRTKWNPRQYLLVGPPMRILSEPQQGLANWLAYIANQQPVSRGDGVGGEVGTEGSQQAAEAITSSWQSGRQDRQPARHPIQ